MKGYSVKIKALTPIWTGDAERKNTELRETGIIGSLRWWYEALIRGLGGRACDPTSDNRYPDKNGNHCDACELFGCTGWSRKFRLGVKFNTTIPEIWIGTREKRGNKYLKRNVTGFMSDGSIILTFIPLREISQNEWALLNKTLQIIADYGALGAKTSQGNGVIEIIENNLLHKDKNPQILNKSENNNELPNLGNFFFYKFHIKFKEDVSNLIDRNVFWTHALDHPNFQDHQESWKKLWDDYHFLPIAFHIKDAIRHLESDKNKRHEIFGESGKGSKIFVSHGYKIDEKMVEVRIWGYGAANNIKDEVKNQLENCLKEKLFSKRENNEFLESCSLIEEKTGKEILGGLK
ncbi:MAG: type III-B CRISPR module RAMP protein Cmr1 [Thermotogae bacterium]|nr:type III-B CRISPR module RAMP protein Cmr1 [Thermotogota bacterium]